MVYNQDNRLLVKFYPHIMFASHVISMSVISAHQSKLLLSIACSFGASLLVAAIAEKKKFAHVFRQLGQ